MPSKTESHAAALNQLPLFDSHFHIIDRRFPLTASHGFSPSAFSCDDYLHSTQSFNVCGGAVVSGSFQGFDQSYLLAALNKLGPQFVGVTQLPNAVSDEEIIHLHRAGVRALRFNLFRNGHQQAKHLSRLANRAFDLVGWHSEFYVDSRHLNDLYQTLINLPAVCIDHLGLSAEGLPCLLQLVSRGVKVKASGFGRLNFDIKPALKKIYLCNPSALMFGTDLPCTRSPRAFQTDDLRLITQIFDEHSAKNILCNNAIKFYKLPLSVSVVDN
ncbi:MAG: 2-pyrone-4,6-dicarboxylate hydrolase [SAR86 cluster bacterium]|uniref:2-pyrone-4,6-dicarboxylate hydrolase n=1 Tax=SAR86 cluster bacterium TaxID=2030880 RepID=A0A2A4MVV6_9GAMM|nr:MAG: 2-pyrone-4,6-dicarboxylate hydrolase [SAR86 cluster bacterium]